MNYEKIVIKFIDAKTGKLTIEHLLVYTVHDIEHINIYALLATLGIDDDLWDAILDSLPDDHVIFDTIGRPIWIDATGIASLLLTNLNVIATANRELRREILKWCRERLDVEAIMEIQTGGIK